MLASRLTPRLALLCLAALITPHLIRAGELAAPRRVSFLASGSPAQSVWLYAGPLPQPAAQLESDAGLARVPAEGDPVAGATQPWRFVSAGASPVVELEAPSSPPGGTPAYLYAFAEVVVDAPVHGALLLNTIAPATLWFDQTHFFQTKLDATGRLHQGAKQVQFTKGRHRIRMRLQAVRGKTAFLLMLGQRTAVPGELRPLPGACVTLQLRGWTSERQQAIASRHLRLDSQPRFIDGEKRLRFHLTITGGIPVVKGDVVLNLCPAQGTAPVWLAAASQALPFAEAVTKGLSASVKPQPGVSWARLVVCGELRSGDTCLGAATTPIFSEANLKAQRHELEAAIAAHPDASSAAVALGRLSLEQADILCENRTYRTKAYGESFASLLQRAQAALHASAAKRDPLAGLSGAQEGAYICPSDGSTQPYRFYIPANVAKAAATGRRVPLLVMLHGYVPYYNKLRWVKIDEPMAACLEKLGWIYVLPFGRSNTDFLSIGEVDVLRVIQELCQRYPIDPQRIYLAGYSMGGSGVWTLLSHYPDRFAAAQVWSGRTDYYHWHAEDYERALVTPATIPPWKRWLIDTDNPYDLTATLCSIPIRAVHARQDRLVKPGHTARIYERLKPPTGKMRMLLPEDEQGHWYFIQEIDRPQTYGWMTDQINTPPEHVEHICCTPKYGRKYWLRIDGIRHWGQRAYVKAHLDRAQHRVIVDRSENVAGMAVLPANTPDPNARWQLVWEEAGYDKPVVSEMRGILTHWHGLAQAHSTKTTSALPSPGLYGPVKEAFNGPFVLVPGTAGDDEADAVLAGRAKRFQREWWEFAKGRPRIVSDADLTPALIQAKHLVLFGSPATHAYLKRIAPRLPFQFRSDGYGVGGMLVQGKNLGLVGIYPNPENPRRYVVIMDGLYYGERLPINHKWDLVPDYIIFGEATDSYDGTNTALLGGLFDSAWGVDPALAHRSKPALPLPDPQE